MTTYRVTASVTLEYNLEDGLVASEDEAREDIEEALANGEFPPGQFDITVEVL